MVTIAFWIVAAASNALFVAQFAAADPSSGSFLTASGHQLYYQGQVVVLRGLNMNNPFLYSASDFQQANEGGAGADSANPGFKFNLIRLGTDYAWYLRGNMFSQLDQYVSYAKQHHMWVIPVMFGAPDADNGEYWNDQSNYWNSSDTDPNSAKAKLRTFWKEVARHYANETAIAGYDIFNEPSPNTSQATYTKMARDIYDDIASVDPNHLVIFESTSPNGKSGNSFPDMRADGISRDRVVWSTHCYPWLLSGCSLAGIQFDQNKNPVVSSYPDGVLRPLWVGEIGASRGGDTNQIANQYAYYDGLGISWAHFVMRTWNADSSYNYGLYGYNNGNFGPGVFQDPWTAMIGVARTATQGTVQYPQIYPDLLPPGPFAPIISSQPASQVSYVGHTAVFTVSASGNPAPSFQWRKNGSNISGASATSYTTPVLSLTDNGSIYSVVVSNSEGSLTSHDASLTVSSSDPSLAAWWKMNDGAGSTAIDSSPHGRNLSLSGSPVWVADSLGAAHSAVSFSGSGQSAFAQNIDLSGTGAASLTFLMSANFLDDRMVLEDSVNFNSSATGFMMIYGDQCPHQLEIGIHGDAGYNLKCFNAPASGWHHYALVLDKGQPGPSEIVLYVDGAAVSGTQPGSYGVNNTNNFGNDTLFLASRNNSSNFSAESLDDLRIYSRALTAAEVFAIYGETRASRPPPPTNLTVANPG